jgi:RND family efflux transporter MFP subunit
MDTQSDRSVYARAADAPQGGGLLLRRVLTIAIPVGLLAAGFFGFSALMATGKKPEEKDDAPPALAVEMAIATREDAASRIQATGEVRPRTTTELSARVSGQVTWVSPRLEAGAQIGAGERLLQIDASSYKLALDTLEADAARAQEQLTRARAEAELAARDYKDLGLSGAPSELALGRPQVASAEASLRAAQARIEEARLSLTRTTIAAPYSGRVMQRNVDVGDFVTIGVPVASLFSTDAAQIRVPLTDADLQALGLYPGFAPSAAKPAPVAAITADVAGQTAKWTGRLISVDAAIDSSSRQTFALIEVPKPFEAGSTAPLAPGVFATVSLEGQATRSLLKLPRGALKRGAEVYVVRADGTIEIRPVAMLQSDTAHVWVTGKLEDGERVVVSYVPSARDGLAVRDLSAPLPPKPVEADSPDDKKKKPKKEADKKPAKKAE